MHRPATRASKLARLSSSSSLTRASPCSQCPLIPPSAPRCARHYHPSRRRAHSGLAAAVSAAKNLFNAPPEPANSPIPVDPLRIVAKELKFLTKNIRSLLGSGHPMLDTVAKYYTQSEGKYVRPMLVLLMSRATACIPPPPPPPTTTQDMRASPPRQSTINSPISPPSVLNDTNPSADPEPFGPLTSPTPDDTSDPSISPSQRRLAEITELIHTASLLHDDVIDHALSRRSSPSANTAFGNKMAVLAGDFLLGRASVALARLRDPEVIELLATVIANLVEGEFMQLKNTAADERNPVWTPTAMDYYLQKTYLKSASLISKSCRAAALLGPARHLPDVVEAAYSYGKNLGLAFQLVDDMLDYTVSGAELGKPAGADLELGLATAPLLFAWEENVGLGELVGRKFALDGDVQRAREIVLSSSGLEQTRALAQGYVDRAIGALDMFPESDAKQGLIDMCEKVMKRRK